MNSALVFAAFALSAASFMLGGAMEFGALGIGLVSLCMLAATVGPRLPWGAAPQLAATFSIVVLSIVGVSMFDTGPLHPFFAILGTSTLCLGILRLMIASPVGGVGVTIAAGLATVLACGTERGDQPFVPLMIVYLGLGLLAIRSGDRGRPELSCMGGKRWWLGSVGLITSVILAFSLAAALPRIYERFAWAPRFRPGPRSGFNGESLRLGSLQGLLQSQRVVLRIHGPAPQHLRGEVYRRFGDDKWKRDARSSDGELLSVEGIVAAEARGELITRAYVVPDEVRHVFLPLGFSDVFSDPAEVQIADITATIRTVRGEPLEEYSFWVGDTPMRAPSSPERLSHDLGVPEEIEPELRAIARQWIVEAEATGQPVGSPREKLDALQRRFRTQFVYSTEYMPQESDSHLLQFLEDKRGHCEYFASALALLGRSLDIPTRLVGGFHVSERNPFGDYAVVRDRDAHAWVEAWLHDEGGWITFDPTPPSEIVQTQAPFLTALIDWISDEFRRRGPLGLVVPLLAILAFVVIRRLIRLRGGTRDRKSVLEYETPPRFVEELLEVLALHGFDRPSHEPIERLARRLAEVERIEEARLLLRCSAARFGRNPDATAAEVESEVRQWIGRSAG